MSKHRMSNLARERIRREQAAGRTAPAGPAPTRRQAAKTCAWCGAPLEVKPVGRIPKWCSARCRQRAWEQTRAAESGRSAVTVVERFVAAPERQRKTWPALLTDLADQLDRDQIYARDLPELAHAIDRVLNSFRRQGARRHP